MKKPFVLIAAIVAVVGLGVAVAVAKETIEVETSMKLHVNVDGSSDPAEASFSGRLTAKKGCQEGRNVGLSNGYVTVGSDRTNDRGKFEIVVAVPETRTYGAGVRERKITKDNGNKIVCSKARAILKVEIPAEVR